MDGYLEYQRSLSEPDSLFVISPSRLEEDPRSSASSAASLVHPPISNDKVIRNCLSVGQLSDKIREPKSLPVIRYLPHSASSNRSSFSLSSSSEDNADNQDSNGLRYERFDDSPPKTESSLNHAYLERMMLTSIPRRKEFSEQFRDLAQLHENSNIPRAKWDDASRLFPKQFGLPPSVAISIWKQVDSDGDMMLTESEYCLAAHLANKYSTTGFSLLASPSYASPPTQRHRGDGDAGAGTSSSSPRTFTSRQQHRNRQSRHLERHRGNRRPPLSNGQDAVYLDNAEDDSHDLLLSPNLRPSDFNDGQPTPWSSSSSCCSPALTCREHPASLDLVADEEEFEEEEYLDDDDHKAVSDDEIGVRALIPAPNSSLSAVHRRHSRAADVNSKRRMKNMGKRGGGRSRMGSSNDSSSSSSSPTSSSSSQDSNSSEEEESFSASEEGGIGEEEGTSSNNDDSSVSRSSSLSSSPKRAASTRVESVCSTSPSVKVTDPVEVLSKVTHRSINEILSLSVNRRRRLLVSLIRAAKSTNYMLLRLNNELAGELLELCDQHTNLNAQVRHLSEKGP